MSFNRIAEQKLSWQKIKDWESRTNQVRICFIHDNCSFCMIEAVDKDVAAFCNFLAHIMYFSKTKSSDDPIDAQRNTHSFMSSLLALSFLHANA